MLRTYIKGGISIDMISRPTNILYLAQGRSIRTTVVFEMSQVRNE